MTDTVPASREGVEIMDPVLLSRAQFGLSVGFHFIFPTTTFGLTLMIVIFETMYLRRRQETYREASTFLIRILALVFVLGVATGLVLSVTIGTNWSSFSRLTGNVFGIALAAEGITAFFLESTFLGVLLFARDKVSKRVYWFSALMVAVGASLSGVWILIANSWMQTPAGFTCTPSPCGPGSVIALSDFWAATLNPSIGVRFMHTIVAGWASGVLFVAGIGAYYLLKGRHVEIARKFVKYSMIVLVFTAAAIPLTGDLSAREVADYQPAKLAAFEGLWDTRTNAPLSLFGMPDANAGETYFYVGIPGMLSFLVHGDFNAPVVGLNAFNASVRPPVFLSFVAWHTMVGIGVVLAGFFVLGAFLMWRKKFWTSNWYLKLMFLAIPLPYISTEIGWVAAEVGRQPWTVYNVLLTADAASKVVPDWQILVSLSLLAIVYAFLFLIFFVRLRKIIMEGPREGGEPTGEGGAYG